MKNIAKAYGLIWEIKDRAFLIAVVVLAVKLDYSYGTHGQYEKLNDKSILPEKVYCLENGNFNSGSKSLSLEFENSTLSEVVGIFEEWQKAPLKSGLHRKVNYSKKTEEHLIVCDQKYIQSKVKCNTLFYQGNYDIGNHPGGTEHLKDYKLFYSLECLNTEKKQFPTSLSFYLKHNGEFEIRCLAPNSNHVVSRYEASFKKCTFE